MTVVLGNAGSGKTREFLEQTKKLNATGVTAFFGRLDYLARQDSAAAFGDPTRFDHWRNSEEKAVFLLDSVDESRISDHNGFHHALNNFLSLVGTEGLSRSTLIISSRPSPDWRAAVDQPLLADLFTCQGAAAPIVRVFRLRPLDDARCQAFVRSRLGEDNAITFMQGVSSAGIGELCERPQDLLLLVDYWSSRRRFDSFRLMFEFMLDKKLTSSEGRPDAFSLAQARAGADALAAAIMLTGIPLVRTAPLGAVISTAAIDPTRVLGLSWSAQDVERLLSRPLFAVEQFGTVSIQHRQFTEYMTARWFARLISEGLPIPRLRRLLFAVNDQNLIVERMRPVVTWLAASDNYLGREVRDWALKADPRIFFQHGDPSSLPSSFRSKLLHAMRERYGGRARVGIKALGFERTPCWLFVDETLVAQLESAFEDTVNPEELVDELVAASGRRGLTSLAPAIGRFVMRRGEGGDGIQRRALRALGRLQCRATLNVISEWANGLERANSGLVHALVTLLYPKFMNADLLSRLCHDHVADQSYDAFESMTFDWLVINLTKLDAERLLDARLEAVGALDPDDPGRWHKKDLRDLWLVEACARRICAVAESAQEIAWQKRVVISIYILNKANRYTSDRQSMSEWQAQLINTFPQLRLPLFDAVSARAKHVWDITEYFPGIVLSPADCEGLWERARQSDEVTAQAAVQLLARAWNQQSRPIKGFISARRQAFEHERIRPWVTNNFPYAWAEAFRMTRARYAQAIQKAGWQWHGIHRKLKQGATPWNYFRARINMEWRARAMAQGKYSGYIQFALHSHASSGGISFSRTFSDWQSVEARWGRRVAKAVQDGLPQVWRTMQLTLPYRSSESQGGDLYMALTGVALEASTKPNWAHALTDSDAERATWLALAEINELPTWFGQLIVNFPAIVGSVVATAIEEEWSGTVQNSVAVLSRISTRNDIAALPKVNAAVLTLLMSFTPTRHEILREALLLLAMSDWPALREICRSFALSTTEGDSLALWLGMCLQADGAKTYEWLKANASDQLIIAVAAALSGEGELRLPRMEDADYLEPSMIANVCRLLAAHIRFAEDIDRVGKGVYSPNTRDHAQEFRSFVIGKICSSQRNIDDLAALAVEPDFLDRREWLLESMDRLKRGAVQTSHWTEALVHEYGALYERQPADGDEFFALLCDRIDDLTYDIERAEHNIRNEINPEWREEELRSKIAAWLATHSRERYSESQEAVVPGEKRTDIRLHAPTLPPLTIELKWADRWTLEQLRERLRNQLCGQYLGDTANAYGVFLLVLGNREARWHTDKEISRPYAFRELIRMLNVFATELCKEFPHLRQLAVLGIDPCFPVKGRA